MATLSSLSDSELLAEFVRGSQSAFGALVSQHLDAVYSSARRQVVDGDLAEDVTQAVFILLSQKAKSFRPGIILPAWLHRATRYCAANALRTQANRRRHERRAAEMAAQQTDDKEEAVDWTAVSTALDEAVNRLPKVERQIIILRYFHGKTHADVAADLGLTRDAAAKKAQRLLLKLRDRLARGGYATTAAGLAAALGSNATEAAPTQLAGAISSSVATAGGAPVHLLAIARGAVDMMFWAHVKAVATILIGVLIVAGAVAAGVAASAQVASGPKVAKQSAPTVTQGSSADVTKSIDDLACAGDLVFADSKLPTISWNDPKVAGSIYGPVSTTIRYFDANYKEVGEADAPGRYGAVLEAHLPDGKLTRRFVTLYRAPASLGNWQLAADGLAALPKAIANSPELLVHLQNSSPDWDEKSLSEPYFAESLAELCSGADGNAVLDDRQWWVGLRRKLYHYDQLYPEVSAPPAQTASPPATVLRIGTCEEAGMDPSVVGAIDAICSKGVKEFPDEPLSFCFARNGVVFYYRAYGTLADGTANTVDRAGSLGSIAKVFTGLVAMMLQERGLIDIDKPLDQFVPTFRERGNEKGLTLHHFLTHMSGVPLDSSHVVDLEEIVADEGQFLTPMVPKYSETGYEFAGCVLEDVTGQDIRHLTRNFVFDPMHLTNSNSVTASGGGSMPPMELAEIGQMFLNRGSYGSVRLIRPATFEAMLPSEKWGPRGGIGLVSLGGNGLPPNTFGYTTHHSGVFRIDPKDHLVIVVSSASPLHFSFRKKYEGRLFQTIMRGIVGNP